MLIHQAGVRKHVSDREHAGHLHSSGAEARTLIRDEGRRLAAKKQ